jgi:hypothetical protein
MDEDLAWLRVQDLQREVENRRLMASSQPFASRTAKLALRVGRALAGLVSRQAGAKPVAPAAESRHHA